MNTWIFFLHCRIILFFKEFLIFYHCCFPLWKEWLFALMSVVQGLTPYIDLQFYVCTTESISRGWIFNWPTRMCNLTRYYLRFLIQWTRFCYIVTLYNMWHFQGKNEKYCDKTACPSMAHLIAILKITEL